VIDITKIQTFGLNFVELTFMQWPPRPQDKKFFIIWSEKDKYNANNLIYKFDENSGLTIDSGVNCPQFMDCCHASIIVLFREMENMKNEINTLKNENAQLKYQLDSI